MSRFDYRFNEIKESGLKDYFQETIFQYCNGGYCLDKDGNPEGIERPATEVMSLDYDGIKFKVELLNKNNYKQLLEDYQQFNKHSITRTLVPKATKKRRYFEMVKRVFDNWFETFHPESLDKICPILETKDFKVLSSDYTQIKYKDRIYSKIGRHSSNIIKTAIEECLINHNYEFHTHDIIRSIYPPLPEDYQKSLLRAFKTSKTGKRLLKNKLIEKKRKGIYKLNL